MHSVSLHLSAFSIQHSAFSLSIIWPLKLEYFTGTTAALLFLGLAIFFVTLGLWSLAGLGQVRKWTAIILRLLVTLCFILILGGARWQRQHKNVEVIVCSDISDSIDQFTKFPGNSYDAAREKYLDNATKQPDKQTDDRIGVISFADDAWIDAIPGNQLIKNAKPIHERRGNGTDIGSALQLGLATFRNDAMRRLVLISDGNQNMGDIDAALNAAAAQHVPIDVFPLNYRIRNEVLMEKMIAPTWKRENEPFTVEIFLRSTNALDVTGKLTVLMNDVPIPLDPANPNATSKTVTLKPGITPFRVQIPGQDAHVQRFKATFEGQSDGVGKVDTLLSNNSGEAFTFVRGKGQVLYIDNARDASGQLGPGKLLEQALSSEGINLVTKRVEQFPTDLVELQNYDAVILANVPKGGGFGGLDDKQDENLARYVHDMGGGLLMLGGPDTFGAGGWISSKLKDVLPVNMEIPAQRQIPKGALVLIMHSCEMPQGNYWGEQCGLAAMKTLAPKDEIGVISYGWNNGAAGGVGGAGWDFTLKEKGDGSAATKAIKNMMLGDMPSFDDAVTLAVKGAGPGQPSLLNSNAKQRHIIIVSDGDPQGCNQALLDLCVKEKISISTVTVFTHQPGTKSPQMIEMAEKTKGRAYGPIENNPNQLPQIFIKEATVVQRSLIHEAGEGDPPFPVQISDNTSDLLKGIGGFPGLRGIVLTSRKDNAQNDIKLALVAANPGANGKMNFDPVLAHWQTGLGRAVVFTGDATARWAPQWAGSSMFSKFWAQAVRSVARPPMSTDFDVQTLQIGTKGKIVVKANSKDSGFLNFMNIGGSILGPDGKPTTVKLVQTGPGTYEGDFDAPLEGNYVIPLHFEGKNGGGELMGGLTINGAPEQRDLLSNDPLLQRIADSTGGRMLEPFNAESANLFSREGLLISASPLPIWDILIPVLLGLLLLDVAVRRIAWDWLATKRLAAAMAQKVRDFTVTTRQVESAPTMDALKKVREGVAEQKFRPAEKIAANALSLPDPKAKFVAQNAVEGDISNIVGGATDKPLPSAPKKVDPKGAQVGGTTNSLLEAKKRAQQQIKQKEQE